MALIHEEETYRILGACFEVYRQMGCGFLESVYHACLAHELTLQGIPFQSKPRINITYKGHSLDLHYEPDFICFGQVIVELKAASSLSDACRAQLHNYLKATGLQVGLLVNFGHYPKLEHDRIAR